jgi:hypothetical protein
MKKVLVALVYMIFILFVGGCKGENLLKISDFLFGKTREHLINMRLEIKNPSKPHTFRFFVDPNRYPQGYISLIHGELDGPAQFNRYDGCDYYPKENCNPKLGYLVSSKKFSKGIVQDISEYYGGKIILRYTPKGVTKGHLYIDVKIP